MNSNTELESKNSQEHISPPIYQCLPALKDISSKINNPASYSYSSKFTRHLKEDLLSSLIASTKSPPALNTGSNHLPSISSSNSKKISGFNKTFDFYSNEIISKKTLEIIQSSKPPHFQKLFHCGFYQ